ncbi:amidohydrolase 2 [Aspergillus insuetus]
MRGKVNFEEAFELPALADSSRDQAALYIAPNDLDRYMDHIKHPIGERFQQATNHGIGYTIYSHTVPGVQGIVDRKRAEEHATKVNDWIANEIKDHRDRLGAFAALSMHDAAQAAGELERCVKQYKFHGALLNNYQHAGDDGETYLFYDQPAYDAFWEKCVQLDVPVYIHPAAPAGNYYKQMYAQRKYLVGPPLSFANDVSLHLLGLITNGVFDRFPKLKIIVGHLGEHIPFDFWRTNHWLEDVERPLAVQQGNVMSKKDIYHYFKNNIWVTTSGHFSTPTVRYVAEYLGPERIMFSVDTPYETIPNGAGWFDNDEKALSDALGGPDGYKKVARENAKRLFKLEKYPDSDA